MPWAALDCPCPTSPLHQQKHHVQAQAGAALRLKTKGEEEEGCLGMMLVPPKRDKPAMDQFLLVLAAEVCALKPVTHWTPAGCLVWSLFPEYHLVTSDG